MQLLTDSTLILLDPKQRGEQSNEQLRDVKNLPDKIRAGLIKVLVLPQKAENGQARLQLPSGQVFTATLPDDIPPGSRLLLQLQNGQPPQILRILLPQTNGQPAHLKPSTNPSVLLDIAEGTMAKEGQTVRFTVPQAATASGAPQTSAFLPTPGMSVMGRTLTLPQLGGQTLSLTNGQQLNMLVPPIFTVDSEVVLKIGQNQTATIDKLRLPLPPQAATTPPANAASQGQTNSGTGILTADGRTLLPEPIRLPSQGEIPASVLRNTAPQVVTVHQLQPNSITIGLQNGVLLTFDIPEEMLQQIGLQSTLQTGQSTGKTATTQQQLMAIRFTDSGVLEVLSTVSVRPARAVEGQNPEGRAQQEAMRQGMQQGQLKDAANTNARNPQLSTGQIATGTVVEQRGGGEVILQFGNNVRTPVMAQRMLPVGSQISVHIMADGHAEILDLVLPKGSERSNALLRFSLQWDTLTQAIRQLEAENPDGAERLKNILPEANEKMLPKLLQLSQSIAQNNMRAFFGDDVLNMLRALGLDGMLQTDVAQLNNLLQKPDAPDGWRALMFPYVEDHSQDLKQGGFFWRKHKKENPDDDDSLRFVLNVQMSNLGPVQLDGFMQGNEAIHMKLRLMQDLDEADTRGLKELVLNSLEAVGLKGGIQVEKVKFFETDPLHDMLLPADEDTPDHQLNVEA